MRRVSIFCLLVSIGACSPDGPSVTVAFDWSDGAPTASQLFARARVETTDGRTLSESQVVAYAPSVELELPSIPIGAERVIRAELVAEPNLAARALYYGVSDPFELTADADVTASVRVAMHGAPSIDCSSGFGGLLVRGAERNVVGREDIELLVPARGAVSVRRSEGTAPTTSTEAIPIADRVVTSTASPTFTTYAVPWTLTSCERAEVCQRTVFVEAVDAEGYASAVCRAQVELDQLGPTIVDETFSMTITPPPDSLLREVDEAKLGALVRVSVGLSEPLEDREPSLDAVSSAAVLPFTFVQRQGTLVVFELLVDTTHASDTYDLELISSDLFGNVASHVLERPLTIDKEAPPPAINTPGASMQLHVTPRGSTDTNNVPRLTIAAAPGSFLDTEAIAVRAPGTNQLLGIPFVDETGGLPETELVPLDVATVEVLSIDAAGNVGDARIVRDVIRTVRVGEDTEVDVRFAPQTRTSAWQQLDRLGIPITAAQREGLRALDGSTIESVAQPRWRETRRSKLSPLDRSHLDMVYDPIRGRTVMFGGNGGLANTYRGPTWEWVRDEWRDVSPPTEAPTRWGHAMVFDRKRGRTMMFGGIDNLDIRGDVWEWDGADWIQNAQAGEMNVLRRYHHGMAYDSAQGRVMACGGWLPIGMETDFAFFDDCWIWDGYAWTPGPTLPEVRWLHDMAYDPIAARFVIFGGRLGYTDYYAPLDDVLYGDDVSWARAATGLPTMLFPRFVYNPAQSAMYAYGYQYDPNGNPLPNPHDLWRWNEGQAQLDRVTSTVRQPPMRIDQALAVDEEDGAVLLFGGSSGYPDFERFRDTWSLRNDTWYDMTPRATGPTTRSGHALVYDSVREVTLLFGGFERPGDPDDVLRSDLWAWDGLAWRCLKADALNPASDACADGPGGNAPSPRMAVAAAFHEDTASMVIHGGCQNGNNRGECEATAARLDETWVWDGTAWSQLPGPPPRSDAAMTAMGPGQVLMVGGCDATTSTEIFARCISRGDAWLFEGASWRAVAQSSTTSHARPSLTYVDGVGAVLFGGCDAISNLQGGANSRACPTGTFVLPNADAPAWIEVSTSTAPAVRSGAAFVYDERRQHAVLFGGEDPANGRFRDTWFFDGNDWSHRDTRASPTPRGHNGRRAVYDRARERVVLYGDGDPFGLNSGVWEYAYDREERPAWVMTLKWNQLFASLLDVQSIQIAAVAGGSGVSDAMVPEVGARLEAWDAVRGGWELIQQHDQPGLDTLQLDATDPTAANRWFVERDAQLYLRVTPRGYDLGPTPAQVSLDYVEATVRYTLPER
ncbi:MAG: hypothetical protein RIT81_42705 [Deltaproteobacteria bacterium]